MESLAENMTKDRLENLIKTQLYNISDIITYLTIWEELHIAFQTGEKYREVYQWSPFFWQTLLHNYQQRFLIETAKLYDKSTDSMGIQKMINICEQNQKLFPKEHTRKLFEIRDDREIIQTVSVNISGILQSAKSKYLEMSESGQKLRQLRDKHLAHADHKYYTDITSLYEEVGLGREEFRNMIDTAGEIMNSFLTALTDTRIALKHLDVDDYKHLLGFAYEGITAYEQETNGRKSQSIDVSEKLN